jgi:hypothetical protein
LCGFGWWVEGMTVFVSKKADEKGQPGAKMDGFHSCSPVISSSQMQMQNTRVDQSIHQFSRSATQW